eukprot:2601522-Prorocentrum_lima.AAC.1
MAGERCKPNNYPTKAAEIVTDDYDQRNRYVVHYTAQEILEQWQELAGTRGQGAKRAQQSQRIRT